MNEEELLKKLLEVFKEEANEHITIIGKGLVNLEKETDTDIKNQILEEIYRSAHSMKGASRAVNLNEVEKICQSLENCFSLVKKGELQISSRILDIMHSVINVLESFIVQNEKPANETVLYYVNILDNIKSFSPPEAEVRPKKSQIQENEIKTSEDQTLKVKDEEIESANKENEIKTNLPGESNIGSKKETIRLSTNIIDDIYLLAEESLQIKLTQQEANNAIKDVDLEKESLKKNWQNLYSLINKDLRSADKSRKEVNLNSGTIDLMESIKVGLKNLDRKLDALKNASKYMTYTSQTILDNLVEEIKNILMLPFSNLLDGFPRMVREIAKELGKEVNFSVKGADIEVDRRIMEELKDPLIHIIRNSVDHGIEEADTRIKKGKNQVGNINIEILHADANNVNIIISDDGRGIDKEKVIKKAINSNSITKEQSTKLSDQKIFKLIFQSGLSTSPLITDISGRGLGLAIVEEKVEKLGGKIKIDSKTGQNCTFTLTVPTTIAKAQGLILSINSKKYILPVAQIIETLRVKPESIKKIENQDTIQFHGSTLKIISLGQILGVRHQNDSDKNIFQVIVVESHNQSIGLVVDAIESEQEVLFKPFNYPIINLENVAGVSLLGTGEICPILNIQDLVKSAAKLNTSIQSSIQKEDGKNKQKNSVLLAEDSITSRLFIKNILESTGYNVKAVIDGKEAFTELKQKNYDLLVSDVEMPRMNGFELTAAVRKDEKLKNLPVILVTSLNKREHQEKGIEAGANAYIIKGSFEQSNLLKTIKRLI